MSAVMTAGRRAGGRSERGDQQQGAALRVLDERLARGEIGIEEYTSRRAMLAAVGGPASPRHRPRLWLPVALVVILLAGVGLVAGAAAGPGPWYAPWAAHHARCAAPALPGRVVQVVLTDMGRMPGGPGQGGGMMGGPGPGSGAMMRVLARPATVPAGTVSLRVFNTGALTHELVVLPLGAGQPPGNRVVGPDNTVSETGSLGEASATCGAGHGDGIAPGAASWVTLTLRPGRYELICNLPGHYGRGMYTALDVR